jgi:magnesium transporter
VVTVVALDFANKREMAVAVDEIPAAMEAGNFVWIDVDATDRGQARQVLEGLHLVDEDVILAALREEAQTHYARYDHYLHVIVSGYHPRGSELELQPISVVLGERFLLTVHRGTVDFLRAVRRDYHSDFVRFARSPSFLLYEIWDHLIENYLHTQKLMGERVEALQAELQAEEVPASVFARVSQLGSDLLHFRKVLLPARAVLADLSTRRSLFLSEATQRFLGNMVSTIDHLLQDMLVDRDILSESLNLHMSLVGHHTNQIMKKLTAVSVVFLPLTFLVGIYGMNFDVFPEVKWRFGYLYFWVLVAVIVFVILRIIRRARLF